MNYSDMKDWDLFILVKNNDLGAYEKYMERLSICTRKLLEEYGYPTYLANDEDFIQNIAGQVYTSYKPRMRTAFLKFLEHFHIVDNSYKFYSMSETTHVDTPEAPKTNPQTKKKWIYATRFSNIRKHDEDDPYEKEDPHPSIDKELESIEELELIKTDFPKFYAIIELLQEPEALHVKSKKENDEYVTSITPYHLQMLYSYMLQLGDNKNGSSDSDSLPEEVLDEYSIEVINGIDIKDEYSFKRAYDTWLLCMRYYNSNDN